jgi:hypothetical protein
MEEMYLVIGGEYSDWWIDSYFTDKDKAEKYCLIKNKSKTSYSELYVEVVSCNESKIDYDTIVLKKYFSTIFDLSKGKWLARKESEYEPYLGDRKETVSERYGHINNKIWCVYCTAKTEEQARKIAFDLIIHAPVN